MARAVSKREQDREARRRAILDAAKRIFAEKGFHDTSVSDIVREVGIAQGTFYLYFEDKKAIFTEIVDELVGTLLSFFSVRAMDQLKTIADVQRATAALSGPLIHFFRQNRDLGKIFLREAVGTGLGFEEKINEFYDELTAIGVQYFRHFEKQGLLKPDYDPQVAMSFLIGGAQMIIYRWVTGALTLSDEEIARSVVNVCMRLFDRRQP